jgi:hypothetical protein
LEKLPHDRDTATVCIAGTIEKDREEVWVAPDGETGMQVASGDVLAILPRASPSVQTAFMDSASGDRVVLKGVFSFDAGCWEKDSELSDDVTTCAPVSRPIRLRYGEVLFKKQ